MSRPAIRRVRCSGRGAVDRRHFPDAITGGLRRTTDSLRAVLERTRGDVTMAATQGRVERALREALGTEVIMPGLRQPGDDGNDEGVAD